MTEWRQVAEFPDYEISESGEVRRLTDSHCAPRGKVLKQKTDRDGYKCIRPFFRGRGRHVTIHRLVAIAFIGEPPSPEHQVAHFDGNQANNHYSNLRWATPQQNKHDQFRHGRVPMGESHWKSKLTDDQVNEIRRRYSVGLADQSCRVFQYELAAQYGICQAHISSIIRNESRSGSVPYG